MNYLLKSSFLGLLGLSLLLPIHGNNKKQDRDIILRVFGKSVETELAPFELYEQINDIDLSDIDYDRVGQFIEQNLASMVTKITHAIQRHLTSQQKAMVVDLLNNLYSITTTTTEELMIMAESCSTYEKREEGNNALMRYAPKLTQKIIAARTSDLTQEEFIALCKELEQVDLHDPLFNLNKNFMCKCSYIGDLDLMTNIDVSDDESALSLQICLKHFMQTIALPYVVFNDFYFFPGWEEEFKNIGAMFALVNTVFSALLEAIEIE